MAAEVTDLVELFDHVGGRLLDRMAGLGDDEWAWCPTSDDRLGLRWRLAHIADTLTEERNTTWLGLAAAPFEPADHGSAEASMAAVRAALEHWHVLLIDERLELTHPLGSVAGPYASATRRSFVLHIADELIHHAAEAALLRDLHAARLSPG